MKLLPILAVCTIACGCMSTVSRETSAVVVSAETAPLVPEELIWIFNGAHVVRTPENQHRVDGEGNVQLPYLGAVHLAGLTPSEAGRYIEKLYTDRGIYRQIRLSVQRADK